MKDFLSRLGTLEFDALRGATRSSIDNVFGSDAGVLLLALASIGAAAVICFAVLFAVRIVGRLRARLRPAPDRQARAAGLARLGARPAEIARALELPRDAVSLIVPADSWSGTKVPEAEQSSARGRVAPAPQRRALNRVTA